MKKISLYVSAALLLLNASSCKKDEQKKDPLTGIWRTSYQAYDKNHNGIIDADEKVKSASIETYEFTADGKLIIMEDGGIDSSTYKHDGTTIVIDEGKDAETWTIKTLDAGTLVMTDMIDEEGTSTLEEMGFTR